MKTKSEYLWKSLRRSQYSGVDVVGYRKAERNSVLAGQTLTCFIDNYEDEAAARAAHPDVTDSWSSKFLDPVVSLDHLPDENDPVAGGMWPDDVE